MHGVLSRRLTKAEALAQFRARPELAANASAASRAWSVPRSTVREWFTDWRMVTPAPPPSIALAVPRPPPVASLAAHASPVPPPPSPWRSTLDTGDIAFLSGRITSGNATPAELEMAGRALLLLIRTHPAGSWIDIGPEDEPNEP